MSNYFLKRNTLILTFATVSTYFLFNVNKIHCYTGTVYFGCPQYGIPEKFKESKTPQERNILRNYTCPVHGTDLILVKTRKNKFDLHEGILNFYTKRGYQVRFLIGNTDRSYKKSHPRLIEHFKRYIIGDYDDRYDNLHFKTFTAFQFVSLCSLHNSNVIFVDDDTFFDPVQKISPAPITCGTGIKNAETTWKKPYGKYYLSNDVWPDNYRYPTYCGGACTILTSSAAQTIYDVASRIEFNEFNIDDMLFTGVYRELANMPVPSVNRRLCHHFTGDYNALLRKFDTFDS